MYIYLVKQCVQKLKEGTDKLKLMIEVKNTRIIQVCVGVGGEEAQGPGGTGGGDSVPPKETHCPSNSRGREVWGVEWVSGGRRGHGGGAGWAGWGFEGSQGPVPGLVFSQNVLAAAQLLPQVRYLQAESGVLLLQEGGADGNLVLLQPPGVPWPLGCHVVLSAPGPVLIILQRTVGTGWGGQESELKKTVNTALNVMPVPDPSTRGRQWIILTAESLCFSLFSVICTQLKGWTLIFNVLTNNDALNTNVLVPFPTFGSVWCHKLHVYSFSVK